MAQFRYEGLGFKGELSIFDRIITQIDNGNWSDAANIIKSNQDSPFILGKVIGKLKDKEKSERLLKFFI